MTKGKKIKLLIASVMIVVAFGFALPKVYSYSFKQTKTATINLDTELKSQSADDSDIEKLDKPAYFNIFNFIFSFLPGNRSSKKI